MDPKVKILMLKGEKGDPGGSTWGNISGTLSNQTDLNTSLSGKANTADLGPVCFSNDYDDLNDKPNLATVATSGSYADLTNKPTQLTDFAGVLPVNQGGTGATDGAIPRRYTLFYSQQGSNGVDINLNDVFSNYEKIGVSCSNILDPLYGEIVYNYSEFVVLPNINLFRFSVNLLRMAQPGESNGVAIYCTEYDFSGNLVEWKSGHKFYYKTDGSVESVLESLNIHYIFGYRY